MAGLGIGYQSPGSASVAITPQTGVVGTTYSVNLPPGATCQWTLNGSPISGATSASYTATAVGTIGCLVDLAAVSATVQPTLAALLLSTTSLTQGVAAGTVLAAITGQTAGSTVAIAAADTSGHFALNSGGTQLLAGLNYGALTAGATPTVALTETLAGAANSPNTTSIGVTIAALPKSSPYVAGLGAAYAGAF